MKTHTGKTLSFFLAILLFSACFPASATPKAAEHENAAVTMGADVERPRLSTKPATALTTADKKSTSTKNRGGAKPTTKSAKANKTSHGKTRGR